MSYGLSRIFHKLFAVLISSIHSFLCSTRYIYLAFFSFTIHVGNSMPNLWCISAKFGHPRSQCADWTRVYPISRRVITWNYVDGKNQYYFLDSFWSLLFWQITMKCDSKNKTLMTIIAMHSCNTKTRILMFNKNPSVLLNAMKKLWRSLVVIWNTQR